MYNQNSNASTNYNNGYGQQQSQGYGQQASYGQQPQQQRPQIPENLAFAISVDIKQSKYGKGDYLSLGIKYCGSNQKEKEFRANLNFGANKFGGFGGYTKVSVDQLQALYQAIGYALQQMGQAPLQQPPMPQYQQPQQAPQPQYHPVAPVAPVNAFYAPPAAPAPKPTLSSFGDVLALNNWDTGKAAEWCRSNGAIHLIPSTYQELAKPTPAPATPLLASDLEPDVPFDVSSVPF